MRIRIIKTSDAGFKAVLRRIIERRQSKGGKVEGLVAEIVSAVRRNGNRALIRYARLFDGVRLSKKEIEIKPQEIDRALRTVPRRDLRILGLAARRIAAFHRRQLEKSWGYRDSLGL